MKKCKKCLLVIAAALLVIYFSPGTTGCLSASVGGVRMPAMSVEVGHRKRVRHYDEPGHRRFAGPVLGQCIITNRGRTGNRRHTG